MPSQSSTHGPSDAAEPRRLTSPADFAAAFHISLEGLPVPIGHHNRWTFVLRRPAQDGGRHYDFIATIAWTADRRPDLTDILTGMADEMRLSEVALDATEWARLAGVPEDDSSRLVYLIVRRHANTLRAWLPVGGYEILLWDATYQQEAI